MIFRRKYSASKFDILAGSKQLMPVTVKFRLDFLVCGLQGDLLWYLSTSAPCFHVTKATGGMKNCRDSAFSNRGLEVGLPAFQPPLFAECHALPKRGLCDMLSKESMPFVKSKPALPTRSLRSLRAAARFTSSFSLHHACKR